MKVIVVVVVVFVVIVYSGVEETNFGFASIVCVTFTMCHSWSDG